MIKGVIAVRDQLISHLEAEDKEKAFALCLGALARKETGIPELYENILAPALNRIIVGETNQAEMIWQEHAQSAIVRSIIEAAYPYVLSERQQRGLIRDDQVLVFCPQEENHEIGARMAADFFLIWGYQVTFLGSNTPEKTLASAIERLKPRYLSISVSNYFNLVAAKKTIGQIRAVHGDKITILAGGYAFNHRPAAAFEVGADFLVRSFADIGNLGKERD